MAGKCSMCGGTGWVSAGRSKKVRCPGETAGRLPAQPYEAKLRTVVKSLTSKAAREGTLTSGKTIDDIFEKMKTIVPEIIEDEPGFDEEHIREVSTVASKMVEAEVLAALQRERTVPLEKYLAADRETQYVYAEMPGLAPEALKAASLSDDPLLRAAAARNINAPSSILDDLSDDPVEKIRTLVAHSEGVSEGTLTEMIDDPVFEISHDAMVSGRMPVKVLVKGLWAKSERKREATRAAFFDRILF